MMVMVMVMMQWRFRLRREGEVGGEKENSSGSRVFAMKLIPEAATRWREKETRGLR